jgi:hypothetical protein
VDVEVDAEKDQRPENDRKRSRQHGFRRLDVREVVVRRSDDDPDYEVDKPAEADPHLANSTPTTKGLAAVADASPALVAYDDGGYFDERVAARYDESAAEMFDSAVVEPAIDLLVEIAGSGRALELEIGTSRIALPLAQRGVPVHGIVLWRGNARCCGTATACLLRAPSRPVAFAGAKARGSMSAVAAASRRR